MRARGGQLFEVEVLDDRDSGADQEQDVAGQCHSELGIGRADDVPGHVVGADRAHFHVDEPGRSGRADAGPAQVFRGLGPKRSVAGADQHRVTLANLDVCGLRGALELVDGDRVLGRKALGAGDVEQHSTGHERRHRIDAQDAESHRGLDSLVDVHPTVQREVLRLVSQRVDVRARMLWHDDDARCTGARLPRSARVVAVQEIVEAGRVGRVGWSAGVAELLEVEDAGGAQSF